MIKTEQEYKRTKKMVENEVRLYEEQKQKLKAQGFSEQEAENLISHGMVVHEQKKQELRQYERIQQGDFRGLENDWGKLLIAFRVYRRMTQAELARRLNVSPSQVSMDESNEYHGISVQKLERIMKVLDIEASFRPKDREDGNLYMGIN
ncbi:helix-turn-helix domain-containing protein [Salinithrix halophila]|uniref:Helix-turn-helix domain-containing protein n=1 Tax=Salinithrix halophila TaxID=1485204 RepID=A0ABV8JG49_9BACL